MLSPLTDARRWLERFRPRHVTLTSPYPVDDCLRRLATVTTRRRATSWYLDSRTVGRAEPRLLGDVGRSRIFVARWQDTTGRNSFTPWLDARPEPAAAGGTTLTGSIGLNPAAGGLIQAVDWGSGLIVLAAIAGGISLLARGDLSGLVFVLGPLALAAFGTGLNAVGLRSLERDLPKLIQEINGLLDSTATFTGPAA